MTTTKQKKMEEAIRSLRQTCFSAMTVVEGIHESLGDEEEFASDREILDFTATCLGQVWGHAVYAGKHGWTSVLSEVEAIKINADAVVSDIELVTTRMTKDCDVNEKLHSALLNAKTIRTLLKTLSWVVKS